MFVREIRVRKFRHLEDVNLGPFAQPPDASDLIALVGPNGGGKSSVLELLSFALSSTWSLSWSTVRQMPESSFEVAISITPAERELVREFVAGRNAQYGEEMLKYLDDDGTYYRAFNYEGGRYQEQATLYNNIHNLVTESLRNN